MSFGADWYCVAVSEGLEPGTSAGTRLFDKEIVVWRDSNGAAHAWEDRCPHRGMRLSFGFVRGDRIACLYHGWQYDAGGQCRHIPAHPDLKVPDTIRTTAYPCRERLAMVWIYSESRNRSAARSSVRASASNAGSQHLHQPGAERRPGIPGRGPDAALPFNRCRGSSRGRAIGVVAVSDVRRR